MIPNRYLRNSFSGTIYACHPEFLELKKGLSAKLRSYSGNSQLVYSVYLALFFGRQELSGPNSETKEENLCR